MKMPDWIKPANWSPETKEAAKETLRIAVVFAIALYQGKNGAHSTPEGTIRKTLRRGKPA